MSIRLNKDANLVAAVRAGLEKTGGYCPCVIFYTEADRCMCEEFKNKVADPEFEGYCHCKLYYKSKDSEVVKND